MIHKARSSWAKFTQDKKGDRVLWQWPNLPIVGWAVFRILAHFVDSSSMKTGFESIGSAFLFVWAYLEITQGASYFRKALGAIVALFLCLSYFN